ncbi:hypothetical protein ACFX12_023140 [Malus domestica]
MTIFQLSSPPPPPPPFFKFSSSSSVIFVPLCLPLRSHAPPTPCFPPLRLRLPLPRRLLLPPPLPHYRLNQPSPHLPR